MSRIVYNGLNGSTASITSNLSGHTADLGIDGYRHTRNSYASNGCASSGNPVSVTQVFTHLFNALCNIDIVRLYNIADAVNYNTDPTTSDTFSLYGNEDWTVELLQSDNTTWTNIGTVSGNNKVLREFPFTAGNYRGVRWSITKAKDANAYIVESEAEGDAPDTTPPSTVTNLTAAKISNSRIDIDSDAATDNVAVAGYQTQVSLDGGSTWTTLSSTSKAFSFVSGNTGFPSSVGTHSVTFRRKAFDTAATPNYSSAWSNIPTAVSITITTPVPVSAFTKSATGGQAPTSINFTDTSTNSPTSWAWDFGDGGTSISQNPSHNYTAPGVYTVTMIPSNAGGAGSPTTQTVTITDPVPLVLLNTMTPSSGFTAPQTIQFTDTTEGTVTNPFWDFGDFIQSNNLSPKHTFLAPGTYHVFRKGFIGGKYVDEHFDIVIGGEPSDVGAVVFDEIELDRYYLEGAQGGPTFATAILGNPLGNQQRSISRHNFQYRCKIAFVEDLNKQQELLEFFITRWGQGIGFRFFTPTDNSWNNEQIALTNTSTAVYKLIRTYSKAGRKYTRRILKPCPDLIVKINGVAASTFSAYTINYSTGIITFATPGSLPAGGILTVTGFYCIPVYFSTDSFEGTQFTNYMDLQNLEVIEILASAFGID